MNWLIKILAAALHVVVSPSLGGTGAANPPTSKNDSLLLGAFPNYCSSLFGLLQARKYTLSELESVLNKKRSTLYQEMSELRKAGCKIKKSYDKDSSEYKYMIV